MPMNEQRKEASLSGVKAALTESRASFSLDSTTGPMLAERMKEKLGTPTAL